VTLCRCGVPELARIGTRIEELAAALRRAEAENRRLGRQIVAVQDQERGDLAREIHDELGPSLFSIKVDARCIAQLAEAGTAPAEAADRAHAILAMADTLHRLSRRILTRLRPVVLDHVPLGEALEEMIAAHRGRHPDIGWSLQVRGPLDTLADPQRVTVYRLVQEAVTNALRHARPSRVAVTLHLRTADGAGSGAGSGAVEVRIDDNGVGAEEELAPGFGITGMHDRVRALGGRLAIATAPDGGTSVVAAIPVPAERQDVVPAAEGLR
jgi:two-component system sensor histidine kinase UhpB